ncbi:phage shock protein C (PspC) family protein [Arcticibacter tournemirensis]|uniref:PspC domain-containing protein n=1 Tax=Arcticibacter tournemirensis TaxID=699437 RepID=A0A4Q0M5U7_9SPHI|nr:PspC domain-containing protein [Arcticibacter tournemirensis]KAA8485262.1 PspC domain-containing protein [Arcticibacter tournemirensis]RXF68119.1 PspC domain-containing protein [Arcticibacter tournemirensis]TQM50454.1 phage shock protein C (PspC) family protein [Arcticibacter tournemirensis]
MEKKLQRDENNKMLAGVAAGLGEYFDVDVTWVRVIFILMAIFGLSGVLIYIILWIVVPPKPFFADFRKYDADYRVNDDPAAPFQPGQPFQSGQPFQQGQPFMYPREKKEGKGRFVAGIILVALGAFFLVDEFFYIPYWFSFEKLWPVILIVVGIVILGKSGKKSTFSGVNDQQSAADVFEKKEKEKEDDKSDDQPLA